jgi:hypothetical protein
MNNKLLEIDEILSRVERLATALRADTDGHVRRSANELRDAFGARMAIEPAVGRMRASVAMLRTGSRDGSRREVERRSPGLDRLDELVDEELLPHLRRLGFDV